VYGIDLLIINSFQKYNYYYLLIVIINIYYYYFHLHHYHHYNRFACSTKSDNWSYVFTYTTYNCYNLIERNAHQLCIFTMAQQHLLDQGLLIIEDSRSHSVLQITLGRTPLDE